MPDISSAGSAPTLGSRTDLWLDGPVAPARQELRAATRCIGSHGLYRDGRPASTQNRPSL